MRMEIQGRAQFVGHIRQELGLVLRGEGEFGNLRLQGQPRLLDFVDLVLDVRFLPGKQRRPHVQFLIALL